MLTPRLPSAMPHWLKDIDATLPVASHYVLHGNIRDVHGYPLDVGGDQLLMPLATEVILWEILRASGYAFLLQHSPVGGLTVVRSPREGAQAAAPQGPSDAEAAALAVLREAGLTTTLGTDISLANLIPVVQAVSRGRTRGAIVIDYLSQAVPNRETPGLDFHRFLVALLAEVHRSHPIGMPESAPGPRPLPLHNPRFLLVDRPADLPPWLVGGADGIRQVPIPLPDKATRTEIARMLMTQLPGVPVEAEARERITRRFASSSEGMTLRAMLAVPSLAADSGVPATEVDDTVRAYRVGLVENKWKAPHLRQAILDESRAAAAADAQAAGGGDAAEAGAAVLGRRVLGQQRAVRHVLDILVRSALGMTSAHLPRGSTGPRGVLFFAGPTGVGKTELAKAMTELLFGDERAYIRFDMSEFAAEHTEARLIGSPPGYVGYGVGGELTNAVRQRPFSVVLFDEIEKAHPRILDKFLQILSDGRLTDGTGATVHFSETIIVFTSNLGVARAEQLVETQRVAGREVDFAQVMHEVIEQAFNDPDGFNRPELLGRIGDNIVIFDHISPTVAQRLADRFVSNVVARLRDEERITLIIPDSVRAALMSAATADLSKGGRGVGSRIESLFVNPLARAVAEHPPGSTLEVTALFTEGEGHVVTLTRHGGQG